MSKGVGVGAGLKRDVGNYAGKLEVLREGMNCELGWVGVGVLQIRPFDL